MPFNKETETQPIKKPKLLNSIEKNAKSNNHMQENQEKWNPRVVSIEEGDDFQVRKQLKLFGRVSSRLVIILDIRNYSFREGCVCMYFAWGQIESSDGTKMTAI